MWTLRQFTALAGLAAAACSQAATLTVTDAAGQALATAMVREVAAALDHAHLDAARSHEARDQRLPVRRHLGPVAQQVEREVGGRRIAVAGEVRLHQRQHPGDRTARPDELPDGLPDQCYRVWKCSRRDKHCC